MNIKKHIERKLNSYSSIAIWGAGEMGKQAFNQWLPKNKIKSIVDSNIDKIGKEIKNKKIISPQDLDLSDIDCVIVCTTAYNEVLEILSDKYNKIEYFFILELLPSNKDTKNEIDNLFLDIAVAKRYNWLSFLNERPQILVNIFYRITKFCESKIILRPLYWIMSIFYKMICIIFSVDLPLSVKIGPGFLLAHLGHVVFHPSTNIGSFVTIYQNVTIGSNDTGGVPILKNFVTVFHDSSVIGNSEIKSYCRVGAKSLVIDLKSEEASVIYGLPAKIQKKFNWHKKKFY